METNSGHYFEVTVGAKAGIERLAHIKRAVKLDMALSSIQAIQRLEENPAGICEHELIVDIQNSGASKEAALNGVEALRSGGHADINWSTGILTPTN